MMRRSTLTHKFVDFVPNELEDGVLYVSMKYVTVTHKCACGCGEEVVTPLSPADWTLTFDGKTVSLDPSIGSWDLPCQSHYWIKRGVVRWAGRWSNEEIQAGRARDRRDTERYFETKAGPEGAADKAVPEVTTTRAPAGWRKKIKSWWSRVIG
jgi:hypothetical protein